MRSHLWLTCNDEAVAGEPTETSLGREDTIECLSFVDSVRTARDAATGLATGRRTYEPIKFRKAIDKSSPILARALCNNEVVSGIWKFYRPAPAGDGTVEHFFTIETGLGRIASIKRVSPDCIDPASATEMATEFVEIVFHNITWTYEPGGQMHYDNWMES